MLGLGAASQAIFLYNGARGDAVLDLRKGKPLLETHSEGVSRENLGQAEHLG